MFGWFRRLFGQAEADPLQGVLGADPTRRRLIVGLGNPGEKYADTRHNVGFRVIERIAEDRGVLRLAGGVESVVGHQRLGDLDVVTAKPLTFMNRSGDAVALLVERLDLDPSQVLIVYDDMDLPLGSLRVRESGSAGTHNGMRSVVENLDTPAIPRLRVGIGAALKGNGKDHVLGDFTPDELGPLDDALARASQAAKDWATQGAVTAMNRHNR